MKRKIYSVILSVLVGLIFLGCGKEYLETKPTSSALQEDISQNVDLVRGSVEGIHQLFSAYNFGQFFQNGFGALSAMTDFLSDDNINTLPAYFMAFYRWDDPRSIYGNLNYNAWHFYYDVIAAANGVLAYTKEAEEKGVLKGSSLMLYRGEAKVIRAFSYFQLVQMFGKRYVKDAGNKSLGVVLRLEQSYDPKERSTVAECYAQINKDIASGLKDLKESLDMMIQEENWGDYAAFVERKNFVNYYTACGIGARIALVQQDYDLAAERALEAMKTPISSLASRTELLAGFNSISAKEWMWGSHLDVDQNMFYSGFGIVFGYNIGQGHIRSLRFAVNRSLYDGMGANDVRRKWFVCADLGDQPPTGANLEYFDERGWETTGQCVKFSVPNPSSSITDNVFMRLSEMYYIAAESKARSGDEAGAIALLDEVMKTRDPEYSAAGKSGQALIDEIIRNKRIEFYWEGLAYFEMKRLGRVPNRLGSGNDKYAMGASIGGFVERNTGDLARFIPTSLNDKNWEFTIPYAEIVANPLCKQNPL